MADEEKKYDAITLDTNVLTMTGKNINLETGLIGSMSQFKINSENHVQFILSEIVYEEILSRMKNKIKKAEENIMQSMESLKINKLLDDEEINKIETLFSSFSLEEEVENIIERFQFQTDCEVIEYDNIELKELFGKYFQQHPPFEGKKKNEFPDAVALMSLERWAEKNKMHILAISEDQDWENYAKKSNWIDVEKDLGKALEKFQEQRIKIREYIKNLLSDLHSEPEAELLNQLDEKIMKDINNCHVNNIVGGSRHGFETRGELEYIGYLNFNFSPDAYFSLVNTQKDSITFIMSINVEAELDFIFDLCLTFSKSDADIKRISFMRKCVLEAIILVTISGTSALIKGDYNNINISNVEVVDIDNIDLGIID